MTVPLSLALPVRCARRGWPANFSSARLGAARVFLRNRFVRGPPVLARSQHDLGADPAAYTAGEYARELLIRLHTDPAFNATCVNLCANASSCFGTLPGVQRRAKKKNVQQFR